MKCSYCGKTEPCKGSYPEGCFLENELEALNQIRESGAKYMAENIILKETISKLKSQIDKIREELNIISGDNEDIHFILKHYF